MSSYVVLARKYRSKQFSDIVGQQSVVRTLCNAIKLHRTHQAYVFSGSRGIGKTSIARIFSKALRCPNVVEKEDGLLYSCGECSDCIEIAAGTSVNVMEIDGASNNGIDSIREIRENVKFLPSSGKYKIYIIDEVHMLSTAAFNGLLKTLEEPPEHVVFIFATTEAHKIPETILGRCQRFDFKRVTVQQVMDHLRDIAKTENIEIEDAALNLIGRAAEGSMRDALSILDQVISFSGLKVSAQAVRESVGLIGTELVFALLKAILQRDAKGALLVVQGAFNQGVDLKVLLKSLQEMLHALILLQVGVEKPETHLSDDEIKQVGTLIPARPLEENELIFQVLHHGLDLLSRASQPKLIFDMLVIKTSLAEVLMQAADLDANAAAQDRGSLRQEVTAVPTVQAPQYVAGATPFEVAVKKKEPVNQVAPIESKPLAPPSPIRDQLLQPSKPTLVVVPEAGLSNVAPLHGVGSAVTTPSLVEAAQMTQSTPQVLTGQTWEGFIDLCFKQRPVLAIILESVVEWVIPVHGEERFKIGFRERDKAKADQLMQKPFRDQLIQIIETYFGAKKVPEIYFSQHTGESVAERTVRERDEAKASRLKAVLNDEVVQEARSLFGAELTNIEFEEKDTE